MAQSGLLKIKQEFGFTPYAWWKNSPCPLLKTESDVAKFVADHRDVIPEDVKVSSHAVVFAPLHEPEDPERPDLLFYPYSIVGLTFPFSPLQKDFFAYY